jgi:hypothetical protein
MGGKRRWLAHDGDTVEEMGRHNKAGSSTVRAVMTGYDVATRDAARCTHITKESRWRPRRWVGAGLFATCPKFSRFKRKKEKMLLF